MKIFKGLKQITDAKPSAICIGNFDGIHLGHQAMLARLCEISSQNGLISTVMLFEPHALEFFTADKAPTRILTADEKLEILNKLGIQQVIILDFTKELAVQSADAFVTEILINKLNVKTVLSGIDFRFGHKREGDIKLLEAYSEMELEIFSDKLHESSRVSSTMIRVALQNSDFNLAKKLLGRAFTMQGVVVKGEQLGRKLSFPTANIIPQRINSPVQGIYAVRVYGLKDEIHFGAASIGVRPAIDGKQEILEVHILDFDRDIYGEKLKLEFLHKLRNEENFDTIEALKQQIQKDVDQVREYFKR